MKKVLTVGVFDLLHFGHVELFRKLKKNEDKLIVAVQDSNYVLKFKQDSKLIYSTEERCYLVKSIRYVDEVIVYRNVKDIVNEVDFDIFALGVDQVHNGFKNVEEYCLKNGKEILRMPRTEGISSSKIKQIIKEMK